MTQNKSRYALISLAILGIILGGCREKVALKLRTDPEPITRRLHLPKTIGPVRWVSASPVSDAAGLPARTDFFDVYAYIELDAGAWIELEKTAGGAGALGSIVIPEAAAALILPSNAVADFKSAKEGREAEGPLFNPASLAAEDKTEVQRAMRIGNALIVQMRVF